jgi:hypothetical protein
LAGTKEEEAAKWGGGGGGGRISEFSQSEFSGIWPSVSGAGAAATAKKNVQKYHGRTPSISTQQFSGKFPFILD